ncbi:hypothetical protein HMPREF9946_04240 [Acetobacteraceae bacterium AT-5844]|nr:hypothetical protein HMPREF9946_04240 [Acetobacteraceae bacterium AT-5844]
MAGAARGSLNGRNRGELLLPPGPSSLMRGRKAGERIPQAPSFLFSSFLGVAVGQGKLQRPNPGARRRSMTSGD